MNSKTMFAKSILDLKNIYKSTEEKMPVVTAKYWQKRKK